MINVKDINVIYLKSQKGYFNFQQNKKSYIKTVGLVMIVSLRKIKSKMIQSVNY